MNILESLLQNIYQGNQPKSGELPKREDLSLTRPMLRSGSEANLLTALIPDGNSYVRGTVLDLRQTSVTLKLHTGETLTARTEGPLPLSIGDTADFAVTSNDGQIVTLKIAHKENEELNKAAQMIEKALQAAKLPTTERSVTVTKELILHNQPVNEQNIRKFISLSSKFPETSVRQLVQMEVNKIPVTKENISGFNDLQNTDIFKEFTYAVKELRDQLDVLPESPEKMELCERLAVAEQLETTDHHEAATDLAAPEEQHAEDSPVLSEGTASIAPKPLESTVKNAPKATPKLPDSRSHYLPPREFESSEKVKQLFNSLSKKTEELEKLKEEVIRLQNKIVKENTEGDRGSLSHTGKLSSSVKFMQTINDIFPYLQLPIHLKEENARGDLYVYEKKREYKPGETVSALLHLDLDNLGSTDILVKLTGLNVALTISVDNKKAETIFKEELSGLQETLAAKGYSMNSSVMLAPEKKENEPLLSQFLEARSPAMVSRFSFDMRA